VHTEFWWGDLRKGEQLDDTGVDRRNVINYRSEVEWRVMDWIYLAQDKDRWRVVVIAVKNLRIP
jgi:hypothetical protein